MIETNEKLLKRHEKKTGEKVYIEHFDFIDEVIPKINSVGNSGDREKDLVEKPLTSLRFLHGDNRSWMEIEELV